MESNYDFHESKEAKEYICQCRMLLHSVEDFLAERTVLDIHGSIPSTDLNKLYEEWCHINNIPAIGRNHFYKNVKDYNKEIKYGKVDSPNGRVNGFSSLRIKSAEELEADNFKRNSDSNADPSVLTDSETAAE